MDSASIAQGLADYKAELARLEAAGGRASFDEFASTPAPSVFVDWGVQISLLQHSASLDAWSETDFPAQHTISISVSAVSNGASTSFSPVFTSGTSFTSKFADDTPIPLIDCNAAPASANASSYHTAQWNAINQNPVVLHRSDGDSRNCEPLDVVVTPATTTLSKAGGSVQLGVVVKRRSDGAVVNNRPNCSFTSSNTYVATVTSDGFVQVVTAGAATGNVQITVICSGMSGFANVRVVLAEDDECNNDPSDPSDPTDPNHGETSLRPIRPRAMSADCVPDPGPGSSGGEDPPPTDPPGGSSGGWVCTDVYRPEYYWDYNTDTGGINWYWDHEECDYQYATNLIPRIGVIGSMPSASRVVVPDGNAAASSSSGPNALLVTIKALPGARSVAILRRSRPNLPDVVLLDPTRATANELAAAINKLASKQNMPRVANDLVFFPRGTAPDVKNDKQKADAAGYLAALAFAPRVPVDGFGPTRSVSIQLPPAGQARP
jgi:hypothetical protein